MKFENVTNGSSTKEEKQNGGSIPLDLRAYAKLKNIQARLDLIQYTLDKLSRKVDTDIRTAKEYMDKMYPKNPTIDMWNEK